MGRKGHLAIAFIAFVAMLATVDQGLPVIGFGIVMSAALFLAAQQRDT